jgi:2-polyprenyl-3-methyl-5-hydroxy-6-metoxy-1,4-benzoquinol methylase
VTVEGLGELEVRIGKPLDVLGLKGTSLEEIVEYAEHLQRVAAALYAPSRPKHELRACPCCDADTSTAAVELVVYGIPYHRCRECGHVFVRAQPAPEALEAHFAETEEHSSAYTDEEAVDLRLAEIVQPKVDWMLGTYRRLYGRAPDKALDVGAGGGHFVAALQRAGLEVDGYELSEASRRFAREVFSLELRSEDFLAPAAEPGACDVVTFWGLLEYTPAPKRFLEAARRRLDPASGLLVVEVPRVDCLGTAVQKAWPESIARHLDPTSHVNCFSDASLETALRSCGFEPVAAWYFGMDAYELLVQIALRVSESDALERLAEPLLGLQPAFDAARLCDDVVIAAVPFAA